MTNPADDLYRLQGRISELRPKDYELSLYLHELTLITHQVHDQIQAAHRLFVAADKIHGRVGADYDDEEDDGTIFIHALDAYAQYVEKKS